MAARSEGHNDLVLRLADPAAGPALMEALQREIRDARTWETGPGQVDRVTGPGQVDDRALFRVGQHPGPWSPCRSGAGRAPARPPPARPCPPAASSCAGPGCCRRRRPGRAARDRPARCSGRGQRLDVGDDRQYGRRFCEQIADRPAACVDPFRHRQVGGDPVILLRLAGILLQGDNLSLDPADDPVEHLAVDVQEAAAWAAASLRPGGPVSDW